MSWDATAKAMHVREGVTSAEKMVMLSLADHHNRETGRCFPAVKTIAEDAIISERQACRLLQSLEAKGFIEIHNQHTIEGRQTANEYTLTWCHPPPDTMTPSGVTPCQTNLEEEPRKSNDNNSPSARNLNSSGEKMGEWMSFLIRLDGSRSMGILSPVDNPSAYARTAARSGSSPPEDVDILLLKSVAVAVQKGMGLETVRLPGFEVMSETSTWFGKCRDSMGEDFCVWLVWASGQVKRTGMLADDKMLLYALTQVGALRNFTDWQLETGSPTEGQSQGA